MEEERKRRVLRANVPGRVHECFISHAWGWDRTITIRTLLLRIGTLSVIGYGTLPNSPRPRQFSRESPLEEIFEFSRTRCAHVIFFLAPLVNRNGSVTCVDPRREIQSRLALLRARRMRRATIPGTDEKTKTRLFSLFPSFLFFSSLQVIWQGRRNIRETNILMLQIFGYKKDAFVGGSLHVY